MNRIMLAVVFALFVGWALAQGEPAQQSARDPIKIVAFPEGKFRLSQGNSSTNVNLQGEIAGCTTGQYDGSDPNSKPSGGAATTRVLDLLKKGAFWYVTFQTTLGSGCNVQGRCGAGTSVTLVWLKLDAALKLVKRQAVIVQECLTDTTLTRWAGRTGRDTDDFNPKLEMRSGVLEVVFETDDYTEKTKLVSSLRYDRRTPDQGLLVVSKKFALK